MTTSDINKIVGKYLGVKYKFNGDTLQGLDCINLCCLVAKDCGLYIPNVNYSRRNLVDYHLLLNQERVKTSLWQEVEPQEHALAVFRVNGEIRHVGYMLNSTDFIHIMDKSSVTVESINSVLWRNKLVGCYKYIGTKP